MTRTRRFFYSVAILAIVVATFGVQAAFDAEKQSEPPHVERPTAGVSRSPIPLAAVGGEHPGAALAAAHAAYEGQVNDAIYAQAAVEETARMAATRAAPNTGMAPPGTSTPGAGVGDCSGFALPDYIIQRESGGNPYAVNPSSGAFGCAQVMPFHWAPGGACAGLDRWNIDDQRTCVDWLSQGGTRLSPWAATR